MMRKIQGLRAERYSSIFRRENLLELSERNN
jgi:hypothetical protein